MHSHEVQNYQAWQEVALFSHSPLVWPEVERDALAMLVWLALECVKELRGWQEEAHGYPLTTSSTSFFHGLSPTCSKRCRLLSAILHLSSSLASAHWCPTNQFCSRW